MGTSRWQMLRTVQLPMARRTIIVGLNQCTMAALSMATIAALINGPGLGQPVAQALQSLDIGNAFVSGIAIVIMAIVLDRTTTAASERAEVATRRRGESPRTRRIGAHRGRGRRAGLRLPVPACTCSWPQFPAQPDLGAPLAAGGHRVHRLAGERGVRLHRGDHRHRQHGAAQPAAVVARGLAVVADVPGPAGAVAYLRGRLAAHGRPRWSACWSSWAPGCGTRP